ncbi:hypothetical protein CC80DRAFT_426304 [Byssothecium circinans]|uniref:F-box domain-containing protein n=1 Tax=Byssothecium circinans TaxID=147558 RepID=A0A6A5TP65_9PLEO|nr:hypothetical protein CC80DRAFT_426304 [Byssothecium circinans]
MNIDVGPEDDAYILFKGTLVLSLPSLRTKNYYSYRPDNITQDPPPPHNCFPGSGYKGTFITAEEMLGCNTAQCLLSKAHHEHGTRDEQDDQDFERGGRYCLSGLCDHVRSRDCGGETILPARHGVSAPIIDSIVLEHIQAGDNYTAIPFHPTCFDIFSRLSRQRFGYVNFEALGQWCFAESSSCAAVNRVSSDENVRANIEQWWQHIEGTEYLAANPLFIPRLTPILRNAIQHDPNFSPMNGAFNVPDHHGEADIFTKLPLELRLQILSYLPSQTIANLRLSSRTFRQLPILLWRDLLLTEMPWLWEVWSDDVPYIWATTTYTAVVEHEQTGKELQDWLEKSRAVIKEEMPDIFNEWDTDVRKVLSKRVGYLEAGRAEALRTMVTGLPVAKTNWYRLYTDIVRNWGDLKGLWNRERIWRDVGEIVRKLDKYT